MEIHPDHPDLADLAAAGRVVAYFGYGSLVNPRTLRTKFLSIRRAEARGWQRFWMPRPSDIGMALLSVQKRPEAEIQGVVVYDLVDHLPFVDEREAGYARQILDLSCVTIEDPPLDDIPVFIYEANRDAKDAADEQSAILQSYLDAVLQGFHSLYGQESLERFVRDTAGFETKVLQDRNAPLYPRAVFVTDQEAHLYDQLVCERGASLVAAE